MLSKSHFETVIHTIVTTLLNSCNVIHFGVSGSLIAHLQFKMLLHDFYCVYVLILYMALPHHIANISYTLMYCFLLGQLLLSVPGTRRKLRGEQAFSIANPSFCNCLLLHIRQASTFIIFKSL